MKRTLFITVLTSIALFFTIGAEGCTSAIFTGKVTPDGRPIIWKHRDTNNENNRWEHFNGEKYNFIGLVASNSKGGEVWVGSNDAGFAIMNTASYNLRVKEGPVDKEGEVMYMALSVCATLADFEYFLDTIARPIGVESNFGVIDAHGGAAFYETNESGYIKVDVNDPKIAPEGYLIYTNFSYTGRGDEGFGYIRYKTASQLVANRVITGKITPEWIFSDLSRTFYHSLLGSDLKKMESSPERFSGWAIDQDYIPRRSSTASVAIVGVLPGENVEMTTNWSVLGYPPVGVAMPLWVKSGKRLPSLVTKSKSSDNAPLCDWAIALKNNAFSIKRGSGKNYFNFSLLYNSEESGYMQILAKQESAVFEAFKEKIAEWRKEGLKVSQIEAVYNSLEGEIEATYSSIINSF